MRMSDCETVDEILSEFAKRDPAGYVVWGQKLLAAHNRECEQLNTEIEAMSKFNDALNAQMKEIAAECEKLNFDNMHLKSEQRTAGEVIIEQTNKVEAKDAEIENLKNENARLRVINCGKYYDECNLREENEKLRAFVEKMESMEKTANKETIEGSKMTYTQFVAKVSEMRNAQKSYFRTRSPEFLNRSKSLEREVDKCIADFYDPQGCLFDGVKE